MELLPFYIGGQVKISNQSEKYVFVCGISNLYVKDNILRFEFIWALKLENLDEVNKVWIHYPEHLREEIDLRISKIFPKKEDGIICIKSGKNDDSFELRIANKSFIDEMTLLKARNRPDYLKRDLEILKFEITSKIDFNRISKINFNLEEITIKKLYLFMRIDLLKNGKIFPFIRISKEDKDNYINIYNDFLDEITYSFLLRKSEINFIYRADGDMGLLSCQETWRKCLTVSVLCNGGTPLVTKKFLKKVLGSSVCIVNKISTN